MHLCEYWVHYSLVQFTHQIHISQCYIAYILVQTVSARQGSVPTKLKLLQINLVYSVEEFLHVICDLLCRKTAMGDEWENDDVPSVSLPSAPGLTAVVRM